MNIIESKTVVIENINSIFTEYQTKVEEHVMKEKEWIKEKELITGMNHRLMNEISEKDKLLCLNDKKMLDYETMINKIQDEALQEMDEKTKHDMLRAQDKEIFERDEEIKRLQKRIQSLEEEKKLFLSTVKEVVEDVEELKEDIKLCEKEGGDSKKGESLTEEVNTVMVDRSGKSGVSLVEKMMDIIEKDEEVQVEVKEEVK